VWGVAGVVWAVAGVACVGCGRCEVMWGGRSGVWPLWGVAGWGCGRCEVWMARAVHHGVLRRRRLRKDGGMDASF
jgi:hypothetical protein